MSIPAEITVYDMVVVVVLVLLGLRGVFLGFVRQITGLVALYLGYIVAGQYHEQLFPFLDDFITSPKTVFLVSYGIVFVATCIVVGILGKFLCYVMQITVTRWFDRLLGTIFGLAQGVIVVLLVHMVLGAFLAPDNQMLRSCATCDLLNKGAVFTRKVIQSEEVRESLRQKDPAISIDAVKNMLNSLREGGEAEKQSTPPKKQEEPAKR